MAYKLLLADDSVTIQRVIELTFADEDIQVIAVGDGQQAIERIQAERPDIILADVGMPERDGFEVASFVKQTPELCHIPVVLLTGAFEPVDQERVRAVGCDGVLAKPFEPQLLIQRVKELLAMPPGARGSAHGADLALDDQPLHVASTDSLDALGLSITDAPDSRASVDEYFDRLDAAFATMTGPAEPSAAAQPPDKAWSSESVPVAAERVAGGAAAPRRATMPAAPAVTGMSPEIAAAFDWLLASEQGRPLPASGLPVPAGSQSMAMDRIVDEITRRVIERLGDRVVRDQVTDIVSSVAERLVREEIERLKAGLK
jgi:CheY-like chemotaxis protein